MKSAGTYYRLGVATAVGTALFLVLGIGALGIIGAGGRPDRIYLVALVVGLVGAVVVRLRARGMAWTLAATAVTMVSASVVAVVAGWHEREGASLLDMVGLTLMYACLFVASAWFFRRAADRSAA